MPGGGLLAQRVTYVTYVASVGFAGRFSKRWRCCSATGAILLLLLVSEPVIFDVSLGDIRLSSDDSKLRWVHSTAGAGKGRNTEHYDWINCSTLNSNSKESQGTNKVEGELNDLKLQRKIEIAS